MDQQSLSSTLFYTRSVHSVCLWDDKGPTKVHQALQEDILSFIKQAQARVLQHQEDSALLKVGSNCQTILTCNEWIPRYWIRIKQSGISNIGHLRPTLPNGASSSRNATICQNPSANSRRLWPEKLTLPSARRRIPTKSPSSGSSCLIRGIKASSQTLNIDCRWFDFFRPFAMNSTLLRSSYFQCFLHFVSQL